MAEPVWEDYDVITNVSKSFLFDFKAYSYRVIAVGNFSSSELYKGEMVYYNVIAIVNKTTPILINEGHGQNTAKITQGSNTLYTANVSHAIRIERLLLWTPPNLKANIDGQLKEYENGWVNINGELKQIDKMWTRIDDVLREV